MIPVDFPFVSSCRIRVKTATTGYAEDQKINAMDADALQTMPIEDTTESIRIKHESAKPGAMRN